MTANSIDALARELVALHETPREVAPFSERYPGLAPHEGYRAARALHAHRLAQGWKPLGRKIGFTNRKIWPRYGVYEPMWGYVYDRTVIQAPSGRTRVPLAGIVQPRIEPELLFHLKKAPPHTRDPEALLDSIESVAHSIEIVQCHHPGWKVSIADCTADNGLHGRLVVGPPVPASGIPDLVRRLPAAEVTLSKADATIDRGVGANVLDSPLNALAFLIDMLARAPGAEPLEGFWQPLAAGEIVSTGVLTDAHPVAPGETWRTSLTGLPLAGLEVTFE